MSNRDDIEELGRQRDVVGMSAEEFGKGFLGGAHVGGKALATLFGGAALAQQVEQLESPVLPDWAKSGGVADIASVVPAGAGLQMAQMAKGKGVDVKKSDKAVKAAALETKDASVVVTSPDFVVVLRQGSDKVDDPLSGITTVSIVGGNRFEGNGYKHGEGFGKHFSFGYNAPTRVDYVRYGKKTVLTDVKTVLFLGGSETDTRVAGFEKETNMSDVKALHDQIIGELEALAESEGWTEIVGTTHGSFTVGEKNSYIIGADAIGAISRFATQSKLTPSRTGFTLAQSPGGRQHTMVHVTRAIKKARLDDKTVVANARDIGKRGVSLGNKILKQVDVAAKKPTAVHGDPIAEILGLVPRKPTAAQRGGRKVLPLAQVKRIAQDALKASEALAKKGGLADKHEALVAANVQRIVKGRIAGANKMSPKGATTVVGASDMDIDFGTRDPRFGTHAPDFGGDDDMLGHEAALARVAFEVLGDGTGFMPNAKDPDPLNPGYTYDGTPLSDAGASAGGAGVVDQGAGSTYTVPGPDNNYGLEPPPTLATAQQAFLEPGTFDSEAPGGDMTTYTSLPHGAIPYLWDGTSRVPGFKDVTSYSTWHGQLPNGKGGVDSDGVPAGFEWHGDDGSKWWVYWPANGPTNNVSPPNKQEAASTDAMFDASVTKNNWGPLVGKPGSPDWGGLRYLHDGSKTWFWFRDKAPDWATAPEIQKLLNALTTDYQTRLAAAKQNYAAQVAQDALDAQQAAQLAKQQAREDAQTQHQQAQEAQAAQHAADIAATQQQTQYGQLDVQQAQLQQQMAQQALAERQQALAERRQYPEQYDPGASYGSEDDGAVAAPGQPDEASVDWGEDQQRGAEDRGGDATSDDLLQDV